MNAREMFEALGYECKDDGLFILYDKDDEHWFNFSKKYENLLVGNYYVNRDELKAVVQQTKELGWLDE